MEGKEVSKGLDEPRTIPVRLELAARKLDILLGPLRGLTEGLPRSSDEVDENASPMLLRLVRRSCSSLLMPGREGRWSSRPDPWGDVVPL